VSDSLRHPWVLVSILAAGLAAWMGLGTLHESQHADSLLTVLISTQRWTPFFWGQDRFGMLVPLLAMPIRHPLGNMLVQGWIMTVAALAAPFVMARFLLGRDGTWLAIGACTNTLFLLTATPAVQFDWLVTQPYALSISLGFAALFVADDDYRRGRSFAALVLLVFACWVNIGIVVLLAIAAVIRGVRPVRLLALQAVAASLASLAATYLTSAHTVTALAPLAKWPNGWSQLLEGTSSVFVHPHAAIGVAVATAAAVAWLWWTDTLPSGKTAVALLAMAVGTWLVLGTSLWVGMNLYSFRYMYPTLMIVGSGISTVLAALLAKWTKALAIGSLSVLAMVAMVNYGAPSLTRIDRGLDDRFGRQSDAILRAGATVIAGDYWRVWPAVFHANLTLARAHARARVFGLAYRSEETDMLWKNSGHEALVAGWPDDRAIGMVAAEHGITITPLAHLPEIELYTGRW
jgi:hypothetical protein